jgi:hypothetical protein
MNQREEGVLKTDHRRILSTYTRQTRSAFEIECHHYETNPDDSFECIDSWNSTLISDRELEISINFTDPLSLSLNDFFDAIVFKAWSFKTLTKLSIPPQARNSQAVAVTAGIG